jgi:membrane-associated PAP2 superfamily phosphatase
MLHMMLEMEYIMSVIPTLNMYYLMHHFQICLLVGITPPMLGAHITESQFLSMWATNDLEW